MLIPDGTILYANTRFGVLSKTPLEQVIGSTWQKFFPWDKYPQLATSLETKKPVDTPEELSLQAADGSFCPVQLSVRSASASGVDGFSVIITDLTERKQSEKALRKTSDELLEKNEQLKAFSYSISHDMRAPLRTMQNFADLLLDEYADKLESVPRSYLERIASSATQLERLINDVLADSQLSRDQSEASTFDLCKMVGEMVENYPNLREANIEIVASSAWVWGYEVALGQCISNLLGNKAIQIPSHLSDVFHALKSGPNPRMGNYAFGCRTMVSASCRKIRKEFLTFSRACMAMKITKEPALV